MVDYLKGDEIFVGLLDRSGFPFRIYNRQWRKQLFLHVSDGIFTPPTCVICHERLDPSVCSCRAARSMVLCCFVEVVVYLSVCR